MLPGEHADDGARGQEDGHEGRAGIFQLEADTTQNALPSQHALSLPLTVMISSPILPADRFAGYPRGGPMRCQFVRQRR